MKRCSAVILLMAIALVFNWSCAKRPTPIEKPEVISTEELVSRVKNRSRALNDYQARLQIKGRSPKGTFRFQAVIVAKLPDTFRLEAFTSWGQTAGVFVINEASARLWIPSEKVIYRAARGQDLVKHFLGLSVPMEMLAYSLIGSVPRDQLDTLRMHREPFGWSATTTSSAAFSEVSWQFLLNPPALRAINVGGGGSEYRIIYEPKVELNLQNVPEKISFTSSQWQMEINVSQVKINPELRSSVFNLQFPDGTPEVDLDRRK